MIPSFFYFKSKFDALVVDNSSSSYICTCNIFQLWITLRVIERTRKTYNNPILSPKGTIVTRWIIWFDRARTNKKSCSRHTRAHERAGCSRRVSFSRQATGEWKVVGACCRLPWISRQMRERLRNRGTGVSRPGSKPHRRGEDRGRGRRKISTPPREIHGISWIGTRPHEISFQ